MADKCRRPMQLFQEALTEQREFMEQFAQETNERLDRMAVDLIRVGEETRKLGEETRKLGEFSRQAVADSKERYNQLFGRMRLTESRLSAMLGATDHDREELRELYRQLDRRLTEVEKRLPPSAA